MAISGIHGSFTEQAVREHLSGQEPELVFCTTAANTFGAVLSCTAETGVIPLSNSRGGLVGESVEAIAGHLFAVVDSFTLVVIQNLLVKPGVDPQQLTEIVSHPQALRQCSKYLAKHYAAIPHRTYADTALAAQDLAEGKLPETAGVLASAYAAKLFGLEVATPDIADESPNITSFLRFSVKS